MTDIVDYNLFCLNKASLENSFFYLSEEDPEHGFNCDLTTIAGCVEGTAPADLDLVDSPAYLRLLLGSHLAQYLRLKIEEDFGYTSTCGISTNKVLSKLVGSKNKPRNQTTLLTLTEDSVITFMDNLPLRKIPGLGWRTVNLLESHVIPQRHETTEGEETSGQSAVTARQIRLHPDVTPGKLESLLIGPGAEKGVGSRVWGLLHGVDPTEVRTASDVPTQISIEDTYPRGLDTTAQISEELHKVSYSLVRRMRTDLLVPDENDDSPGAQRWIARPRTLRLTIRSWSQLMAAQSHNSGRVSRSGPLPNFIFDLKADVDEIAQRLVAEALLPLLRRLQPDKGQRWKLQLVNVCVANMVGGAADDKTAVGRDIAVMFKRQDEVLRPFQVASDLNNTQRGDAVWDAEDESDDESCWDSTGSLPCPRCQHLIPQFAMSAHSRYHELGERD